jgi:hypothetical protein
MQPKRKFKYIFQRKSPLNTNLIAPWSLLTGVDAHKRQKEWTNC